jgi:hypothetical protein
MAGTRSDDHFVSADLTYRPPSSTFNASPPRRMLNQLYWVKTTFSNNFTTSTTAITENNTSYNATTYLPQSTSYFAVFDQYMLHSVTTTYTNTSNIATNAAAVQLFTALDFDNTANLGSAATLGGYSTCYVDVLGPGKSVTRFVKPCVAIVEQASGNTVSASINRSWVDSAYPSVLFYGNRAIAANTTTASLILIEFSCIWCFRNNI